MIELGHIHAGYEGRPVLEDVTLRADGGVTCIIAVSYTHLPAEG